MLTREAFARVLDIPSIRDALLHGMPKLSHQVQPGFAQAGGKKRKKGGPWGLIKSR